MVKICITNINKTKLKTSLKITKILADAWLTSCIKPIIYMLAKHKFVYFRINLILKDNSKAKAKILSVNKGNIFLLIHNVRISDQDKIPDFGIYNLSKFWPKTKVAIELQIHSCNFKRKGDERNLGYFSKLIEFYKFYNIKILPLLTPKKNKKRPISL